MKNNSFSNLLYHKYTLHWGFKNGKDKTRQGIFKRVMAQKIEHTFTYLSTSTATHCQKEYELLLALNP